MKDIAIIGAGKLGTSLGTAFSKQEYKIRALSCRSLSSAKESRQIIQQGTPTTDNLQAGRSGKIIVLSVPDDRIEKVAGELARSSLSWKDKLVFHCSGLIPASVLDPLKQRGAKTLSLHPAQTFSQKKTDPHKLKGVYFALEGSKEGLSWGEKLIQSLGGHPFILKAEDKPFYHLACSTASNLLVVLLHISSFLLQQRGISEEKALKILFPLVQETLHNVKDLSIPSALTGPVVRGDHNTVQKHLHSLKKFPSYRRIYKELAVQALEVAQKENKLTPSQVKSLKSFLEDK